MSNEERCIAALRAALEAIARPNRGARATAPDAHAADWRNLTA